MKKYLKLIDKFFYTFLEDLLSWRNKIVIALFILCFLTVKDAATFGIAAGLLTTVVIYYFHLRQKSQDNGNCVHKSQYNTEIELNKAQKLTDKAEIDAEDN